MLGTCLHCQPWKAEAGGSGIKGLSWLPCEFEDRLAIEEPVSKNKTKPTKQQQNQWHLKYPVTASVKNLPFPGVLGIATELKIFTLLLTLEIVDFPKELEFYKLMCCETCHDIYNTRQMGKKTFSYV